MRLAELARRLEVELDGDGEIEITGLAPVDEASPGTLTFVTSPRYSRMLAGTRASAAIVGVDERVEGLSLLRAQDPYRCFVAALELFDKRPLPRPGVHPGAVVAASATLGKGAYVGPCAVIGEDAVIGRDARIHPQVTIYPGVRIGDRFTAHAGAVVREGVVIGDDVTLQPGAVVGADGFGFLPVAGGVPKPIPQAGGVVIASQVDVGANTTVDRAAVGNTSLGTGVKLDNLVMVAHGCRVGGSSMLAAQTGLAGSTLLGREVLAGGQVGTAGHVEIGDRVQLAARCGVTRDVAAGSVVGGVPAVEIGLWKRCLLLVTRLPELFRRLRELERRLEGKPGRDSSAGT
ncbi:MAG: UDP-3-O-(3-hydroxymyristoyl)glucosamine N-acyltransferase [Candidatus Binatia bacterium]